MRSSLIAFVGIVLFQVSAVGQSTRQVSGRVMDSVRNPVGGATIWLFSKQVKDTLKTTSNNNGYYNFKGISATEFTIRISSIGFLPKQKTYNYPITDERIQLEDLTLNNSVTTLQEVIIAPPPIQVREDTVEYKADSFRVKPNSMVEDLLKKMPGIEVDKNGDITAQGKKVSRIKVNGKDFFGGDPKTATKELPADLIDKVQVVDDYGDLSAVSGIKDGEPEKVINLQLKKDKNKGIFGRATAGYGTDDRYQANGNINLFDNNKQLSVIGNSNNINGSTFNTGSGGGGMELAGRAMGGVSMAGANSGAGQTQQVAMIGGGNRGFGGGTGSSGSGGDGISTTHSLGTNFRNDFSGNKGSLYGSYSFTRRMTDGLSDISQQNFYETNSFVNDQNNRFYNQNNNHRAFINFEYQIDSFNYIKISPSFSYGQSNNQSRSDFQYYMDKTTLTTEGINKDSTISKTPNLNANIIYNHRFRKRGRNLSVNVNMGGNSNESESDKYNLTNNYNLPQPVDLLIRQAIFQDNESRNYGFRLNYSEPIRKDRFIDLIYSYNRSYTKNDRKTYDIEPNDELNYNPALSNAYENVFINQRYQVNMRTVKKKYNYTLGVMFQPVNLQGYSISKDSGYTPQKRVNIFPVARLAYNFTKTKNLNFNYFGNARQPGFEQLQPVRDISNPQYQTQGNPNLKPEQNHNFSLMYNNFNFISGRVFFVGSNFMLTQNKIVNNNIQIGNSGAQLSIPENVNGFYNATGFYNFSKPYKNRTYVFSLNGMANFNHNITLIDSARNVGNNLVFSQGFNFTFNHKDWLEWDAGVRYAMNSTRYSLDGQQDIDYSSWTFTSASRIDIKGGWIFRYDFEYVLNNGLAAGVNQNIALLNASFEKTIFKKKNGFIRVSGFDILKQNQSITRTVSGNYITDTRTNRLTRYFMLTFTYRLTRFKGQNQNQQQFGPGGPGGMRMMRD
ncbi:outer membrane beta-barrel family protein [Pollutibacter soli]|uniref:outer membrane beta-barrel family protein n=1 Tax=Pollutibacter soli TaxID=3034157 RepID=UPI003013C793